MLAIHLCQKYVFFIIEVMSSKWVLVNWSVNNYTDWSVNPPDWESSEKSCTKRVVGLVEYAGKMPTDA
jgi:hypothetical protein